MKKTIGLSILAISLLVGCQNVTDKEEQKQNHSTQHISNNPETPLLNTPLIKKYEVTSTESPKDIKVLNYTFIGKDFNNFFVNIYQAKPKEPGYDRNEYSITTEKYQFENGTKAGLTVLDHLDSDSNDYHFLWKKGKYYYDVAFINHTKEDAEKILKDLYPKN